MFHVKQLDLSNHISSWLDLPFDNAQRVAVQWSSANKDDWREGKQRRKVVTMANQMTLASKVDGAQVTIKNGALRAETQRIVDALNEAKNSLYVVAYTMNKIHTGKLYVADGFADIYDYGNVVFGYKRAMVNNLVRVGATYLTSDGKDVKSLMAHSDDDYSVSQIQELLTIPVDEAKRLDAEGKINPDMTTKEIREVVQAERKTKAEGKPRVNKLTEKQIDSAFTRITEAVNTIMRGIKSDDTETVLALNGAISAIVQACNTAVDNVRAEAAEAAKKPAAKKPAAKKPAAKKPAAKKAVTGNDEADGE